MLIDQSMQLGYSNNDEPGLYLRFAAGNEIALTERQIRDSTQRMLEDPQRIPPQVREAAEFPPCSICPARDTSSICHSITAVFPVFDELQHYKSYERVTAIYVDGPEKPVRIRETTMQEALKYLAVICMMHYCEVGQQYAGYFDGVCPLMSSEKIAHDVFKNILLSCRGDMDQVSQVVQRMRKELLLTTRCQTRRLRLISRGDAICNAFVTTQTAIELMIFNLEDLAAEQNADTKKSDTDGTCRRTG